ncbi:MAG: hypothetical protein ACTSUQ_02410, partial [Candidatus Freyarchaeota archaeon]
MKSIRLDKNIKYQIFDKSVIAITHLKGGNLPSWSIHLKWAKLFGMRQSVAEFANKINDDPKSIHLVNGSLKKLIGHDWGEV